MLTSPAYPTYSIGILWNMNAADATVAALAFGELSEIPLDGDAAARAANRAMLTRHEWRDLKAIQRERLRNNHHEINRPNR